MRRTRDAESELARLLERVDEAVDGAPDEDGDEDGLELTWEVWASLPLDVRELLLTTAPAWWVLPAPPFRRLLLTAAGFIVWEGMLPLVALRRAAARLRLPPPRRASPPIRSGTRPVPTRPYPSRTASVRPYPARRMLPRSGVPRIAFSRRAVGPLRRGQPAPARRLGTMRRLVVRR